MYPRAAREEASVGIRGNPCLASPLSRQCLPQSRVDLLRGLLLHARHHMAVRVQGDTDGGVTEAFGDDLGVNAHLEQLGRVRMAQIMETAGDALLLLEAPPDAVAVRGSPGATASTNSESLQPGSQARVLRACSARRARRASTTSPGRVMRRRLLVVFGSLQCSSPKASWSVWFTVAVPALRSTSLQRRPSSSPRRMPVPQPFCNPNACVWMARPRAGRC